MNQSKTFKILILSQLLVLLFSVNAGAEILKPVKWKFNLSSSDPKIGDTITVSFNATIDEGWYLYSSDFDPELGPMVTTFNFEKDKSYDLVEHISPIDPKKKYDDLWEGEYTYFKEKGVFEQRIIVKQLPLRVYGTLSYQTCSDESGKCIPFEQDFELGSEVEMPTLSKVVTDEINVPLSTNSMQTILGFAILAFFGGISALLTPCVFPMIPMTVSYFTGKKNKSHALIYGFFIILIYTLIGSLLAPLMGPNTANELATGWLPNVIFFIVFLLFSLSFFGLFEITLPSGFVNAMDANSDRKGLIGVFFMALTLVVVSFSCTGPIVGSILVKSAGGEVLKPIVGMFAFSLAFAIPFMLFAIFPNLMEKLPKSGGWLNSVKVILGFIEFALAFKFLSVADQAYHWGILDRDVYLCIWIVTFSLMGFYLLGKIRLPHDSPMDRIPVGRLILGIATFSFVIYLVPGLFGAPLKPLSGYLPPLTGQDFKLTQASLTQSKNIILENDACEPPLYTDILHFPHGINGYFNYDQAIACAKALNKPLFIDFTGHGCVNCREMEARVWSDPRVLRRLKEDFVVLALYVDDKLKLPENKWYTSSYDNKLKKTMGHQNADFQITRFENNAQPFYPIVDHQGTPLIKQPIGYNLDVLSFVAYLDSAKENFRQNQSARAFSTFQ